VVVQAVQVDQVLEQQEQPIQVEAQEAEALLEEEFVAMVQQVVLVLL
jgi:hypothetical protein